MVENMPKKKNGGLESGSRRDFMKICSSVAAILGLESITAHQVAAAFLGANKPPVIWLHFAECTGCTEAALRTTSPWFDDLILKTISLEYHETLMAGAGETVETIRSEAAKKYAGQFICVVEGSIPTAANGVYGMIGDKTMLSIAQEICTKAKTIIAIGSCASFGGIAAASPNPTGAKGISEAIQGLTVPVINCPGCPPNGVNFISIIANYLLTGSMPELDSLKRPRFAYGQTNHSKCPYEDYHKTYEGRCLEDEGCKGPRTYNNCTSLKFNGGTCFPMQAGHPCIGCSEPKFWDTNTPFYRRYHLNNATQIEKPYPVNQPQNISGKKMIEIYDLKGRRVGIVAEHQVDTFIKQKGLNPNSIRLFRSGANVAKKIIMH